MDQGDAHEPSLAQLKPEFEAQRAILDRNDPR
jgi:hypothetical protein